MGKTIEQSVLEVMEEEELECLRAQQKAFEELRNAELAEVHRMQEQNRRRTEEKVWNFSSHVIPSFLVKCLQWEMQKGKHNNNMRCGNVICYEVMAFLGRLWR